MFDIVRGSGSVFLHPGIWSQLLPIATGWGSRATYSKPSAFHEIPGSGAGLGAWGKGYFLLHALRAFSLCFCYLLSWGVGLIRSLPPHPWQKLSPW